jgi:hypothetical protein
MAAAAMLPQWLLLTLHKLTLVHAHALVGVKRRSPAAPIQRLYQRNEDLELRLQAAGVEHVLLGSVHLAVRTRIVLAAATKHATPCSEQLRSVGLRAHCWTSEALGVPLR